MKIKFPLSTKTEVTLTLAEPNRGHGLTKVLTSAEFDALSLGINALREQITGKPWSDAAETAEETAEPDYAALIDVIKQTGGSVEINGVKITPCDTYGRTQAEQAAADGEPQETNKSRLTHLIDLPLKIGSTLRYAGEAKVIADEYSGRGLALVELTSGAGQRVVDKRAITHIDGKAV